MDTLIPVINKLQDVFASVGCSAIDLPQIVVVGAQSSGKSSVLENLVGRDFLPRGIGLVTRRPLILQLIHHDSDEEYGEFGHRLGELIFDFNEIRNEIERDTAEVSGDNKGISAKPITLRIWSSSVLNLTLVDLPGITKIPVGEQPKNIEKQITDMILHYISNPSAIILAVTPANTDFANSDAMKLAKRVDPEGVRTIGVITKIDLMDKGTHCMEVLQGKVAALKLGYVGVVNRSQQDIQDGKSIVSALDAERVFFASNPVYRSLAGHMGMKFLAKTLNSVLMHHIHSTLPTLKASILRESAAKEKELLQYGLAPLSNPVSQGAYVLNLISKFSSGYRDSIEGRSSSVSGSLYGGARISYLFHHTYSSTLKEISPFDYISDQDIRTAIANSSGPRPCLFVSEASFELLVKTQISRLEEASLTCLDYVFAELQKVAIQHSELPEISRFKNFKESITETVNKLLVSCMEPARDMIKNLISIERAYINTNHPDFINGSKAVAATMEKIQEQRNTSQNEANLQDDLREVAGQSGFSVVPENLNDAEPSEREIIETELIKSLITSYFSICRKNVEDAVPKAIMHFLVNRSREELQSVLVQGLYKEDLLETLLEENDDVSGLREECLETLTSLRKAVKIVNELRDTKV